MQLSIIFTKHANSSVKAFFDNVGFFSFSSIFLTMNPDISLLTFIELSAILFITFVELSKYFSFSLFLSNKFKIVFSVCLFNEYPSLTIVEILFNDFTILSSLFSLLISIVFFSKLTTFF